MPTFEFTSPDGKTYEVQGPDGATQEQAFQMLQQQIGAAPQAQEAPQQEKPVSQALGAYQGLMKPLDNAAKALEAGLQSLGVPTGAVNSALGLPSAAEAQKKHQEYVAAQPTQPGGWGRFGGEYLSTLPLLMLTKNPALLGAGGGALTTDAEDAQGVLTDAAVGAVAGKTADVALKGAGRLIAPKVDSTVRKLIDEGVTLTPGQILGGVGKRLEDAATSIPIVGDSIKSAQRKGVESFNVAAINRALEPIGAKVPATVKAGHEAVAYAGDALGDAYDKLLPQLTVKADQPFAAAVGNLLQLAQNLPKERYNQVAKIIQTNVSKFSQTGIMSGETMKAVESDLGRMARQYGSSSVGDERLVGDALKQFQQELRALVTRSNPAQAAELSAINSGYANLVRVENAAKGAKDGIFTPGQLQTATRVTDSSVRKRASARGEALMQDLATAGRERLPSSVPDSGTPTRLMTNLLAGGGAAYIEPSALAAGLGVAGAYTQPAQAALRLLLARTPSATAKQIADYLAQLSAPAAVAGSAALSAQ